VRHVTFDGARQLLREARSALDGIQT